MFPSRSPFLRLGLALGIFLPALLGGFYVALVMNPTSTPQQPQTVLQAEEANGREVFKVVDQMPLFPGKKCGQELDYCKRQECAQQALLEYIYANIRYPKKAKDKNIQGTAVVSFIVEAHGAITNIKVVRDPGGGLGAATAAVVSKMSKDHPRWEPGLQKGKAVAVEFMLPVKFKLK